MAHISTPVAFLLTSVVWCSDPLYAYSFSAAGLDKQLVSPFFLLDQLLNLLDMILFIFIF